MKNGSKILLIDDEPGILEVLTYILQREGYVTDVASDGIEAIDKIRAKKYSAIVCDYYMPRMDGITLLKKVRSENIHVPFIFLSGHAGVEEEHVMVDFGTYKLVQKPDFESVKAALRSFEEINETDEFMELVNNTKVKFG